jgi:hypothetical protein
MAFAVVVEMLNMRMRRRLKDSGRRAKDLT